MAKKKKFNIPPDELLTRKNPVFWLIRLCELIIAVFAGWIVYGLVVGLDGTTLLGDIIVTVLSIVLYLVWRRKMLKGEQPDQWPDGY